MNCQFWNYFTFWMGNYNFRCMPTASTKCVNFEWRSKGRVSKVRAHYPIKQQPSQSCKSFCNKSNFCSCINYYNTAEEKFAYWKKRKKSLYNKNLMIFLGEIQNWEHNFGMNYNLLENLLFTLWIKKKKKKYIYMFYQKDYNVKILMCL